MERNTGLGDPTRTYAYSPYGELEEGYTEEGTPFLFQGDYLDPDTSLYHMQACWYDPSSSTFLSPDPEMGDPSDPQRRLPYAYCAGDPVGNRDPTGRFFYGDEGWLARGYPPEIALGLAVTGLPIPLEIGYSREKGMSYTVRNQKKAEARSTRSTAAPEPPEYTWREMRELSAQALHQRDLMAYLKSLGGEDLYLKKKEDREKERKWIEAWRAVKAHADTFYAELTYEAPMNSPIGRLTLKIYINDPAGHRELAVGWRARSGKRGYWEGEPRRGPIPSGAYEVAGKQTRDLDPQFGRFAYQLRAATFLTQKFLDIHGRVLRSAEIDVGNFLIHEDVPPEGTMGCVGILPEERADFDRLASLLGISGAQPGPGAENAFFRALTESSRPIYLFVSYPVEEYMVP